jgi:riboflavin kinase/FMN adenylyltransferase
MSYLVFCKHGTIKYMITSIVTGIVVKGDEYGRILGFPTANLDDTALLGISHEILEGIYAGYATLEDGKLYYAGIIIRTRPEKKLPTAEVYLLDFEGEIYGQRVELSFSEYIRPYTYFDNILKLQDAIREDIQKIRTILIHKKND